MILSPKMDTAQYRLSTTPKRDGYAMPAEFSPHEGTLLVYPERPGSWTYGASHARKAFRYLVDTLLQYETVTVLVSEGCRPIAEKELPIGSPRLRLYTVETDDCWARDTGPTFVKNQEGDVRAVDWCFNAWGGDYDGLYANWERDNRVARTLCEYEGRYYYDAQHFVLEGGSIHSDGEGTILVTESCLLSKGRNPSMTREQIEENLLEYLGAETVLWLPRGIVGDETNEHVDNVCAFLEPAHVVLAWTDNPKDPQYQASRESYAYLSQVRDARGRRLTIETLPIPEHPVCITQYDLDGFVFEEGEDTREVGERLAASYVNFYFCNGALLLPQFGGDNVESDVLARERMQSLCPDRRVIPIPSREFIVGGGNIHCLTQQIPRKGV